ncbi:MAG: fused MFS/spermidine synthase [Deltaproteobacteria bacterium]|nr:fused MFS/spermidine synthase [Deltaproteobacteria bacterium]
MLQRDVTPVLLVASGAAALGAEIVWLRHLARLVGATADATALVLAVFMTGLALGALVAQRHADRMRRPLLGYAVVEAVVGLVLVTTPWLAASADATASLDGGIGTHAIVIGVLLVPTLAMGTTLPLAMAHRARGAVASARDLGILAGANTAGGIVGLIGTVHVLLPTLGMRATAWTLGAVAGATALACVASASRSRVGARVAQADGAPPATPVLPADGSWLALGLLLLIGTTSFALQIAWNRAFAPLFGSALVSFALVAAAILAGLTAGALRAAASRDASERPWELAASSLMAFAICVFVGTVLLRVAPFVLERAARGKLPVVPTRIGLALVVAGSASYLVGVVTPVLASLSSGSPTPGRTAARALLASTSGNVVGALIGSHLLGPLLGPRVTLLVCAGSAAGCALAAAWRAGRARTLGTLGALAVAVPLAALLDRPWDAVDHAAGPFQIAAYRHDVGARAAAPDASRPACRPDARFGRPRSLHHADGALASVTVLGYELAQGATATEPCSLYSLRSNGRAEGSLLVRAPLATREQLASGRAQRAWSGREVPEGDLATQVLGGALGVLGAERPGHAFVVGWGTGTSVRALLAGSPRRVDAVEIEPAILDAARLVEPVPFRSRRARVTRQDARIALRGLPAESLDVVASHPSNPWVAAATSLFSRQYVTLAHRALRPGGRFVAWVQLYAVDLEIVRALLATFRSVFPDVHVIRPSPRARDLLVLGIRTRGGQVTPERKVREWLDTARASSELRAELSRAALDERALRSAYIAGPARVRAFTEGVAPRTDDDLDVEMRSADHLVAGTGDDPETLVRALRGR